MRSWGETRTCRATVIRDILRGRLAPDPDPHGLRLRGARISGPLDLENLTTDVALGLTDCLLEEGLLARDACLSAVDLTGCHLEHAAKPPLDASGLTCSVLELTRTRITGHADAGVVTLAGAHIRGSFSCAGARLRNDSGPALVAGNLQVDQDMSLGDGFTADGTGAGGAVLLAYAHIGMLGCSSVRLRNDSGPALNAFGLQVDRDMFLVNGFTADGAGDGGAVSLVSAHIGHLDCTGARLRNNSGPALNATGLQADQGMSLGDGFTADRGAVILAYAHIGMLDCSSVRLRNDSGPALNAFGLQVDRDMFLDNGFTADGAGDGAVDLRHAHISGMLNCTGARLRNNSGPALNAFGLQVGPQGMLLVAGFTADGTGDGAVDLRNAHISGMLNCSGARLRNNSGPALNATGLQANQGMLLVAGFTADGAGAGATVDLTDAHVGGTFLFNPARLTHATHSQARLAVDGLTYAGVPEPITARDWLQMLRGATRSYAPQPYQQLAARYRELGDERQVRKILMAQRDHQLAGSHTRLSERLWGRITKITVGYGYQPWRALLFLAGVVVLSCVLAIVLGSHGALAQTDKTAKPGQPCTLLQQITVGLDLNLPIGKGIARAQCDLAKDSASAAATWLTVGGWVLQILAWAFAALFIAGFTSAVRKT